MRIENPTKEQINFARAFLEKGKIANRGKFDGDNFKQLFGLVAQVIVGDYLKLPRPENSGFDGGVDLVFRNKKFDVKCEIRTVDFKPNFAHNLSVFQIKYKTDGYIFVSYNSTNGEYTICGWIFKTDFLNKAELYKTGSFRLRDNGTSMIPTCDYYEIKNRSLKKIEDLWKLK